MRQKQADNKIHFTPDNLTEFVTGEMNWKNSTIVGLYVLQLVKTVLKVPLVPRVSHSAVMEKQAGPRDFPKNSHYL